MLWHEHAGLAGTANSHCMQCRCMVPAATAMAHLTPPVHTQPRCRAPRCLCACAGLEGGIGNPAARGPLGARPIPQGRPPRISCLASQQELEEGEERAGSEGDSASGSSVPRQTSAPMSIPGRSPGHTRRLHSSGDLWGMHQVRVRPSTQGGPLGLPTQPASQGLALGLHTLPHTRSCTCARGGGFVGALRLAPCPAGAFPSETSTLFACKPVLVNGY